MDVYVDCKKELDKFDNAFIFQNKDFWIWIEHLNMTIHLKFVSIKSLIF